MNSHNYLRRNLYFIHCLSFQRPFSTTRAYFLKPFLYKFYNLIFQHTLSVQSTCWEWTAEAIRRRKFGDGLTTAWKWRSPSGTRDNQKETAWTTARTAPSFTQTLGSGAQWNALARCLSFVLENQVRRFSMKSSLIVWTAKRDVLFWLLLLFNFF